MLIGIIGAGIAGLTAGRILSQAGHEVVVFEKSRGFGGRMATRYYGEEHQIKMDHGITAFTASDPGFQSFVDELIGKGLVKEWANTISYHNGEAYYPEHPMREYQPYYVAPKGMNSIGKYMSRWMDFYQGEKVGGVTYFGNTPQKKRSWMINLSTINVVEVDAVIVATPAIQTYGIIQTAQDETDIRRIIKEIDSVRYTPCWTMMAGFDPDQKPDWKGIQLNNSDLGWISNESSKRENGGENTLVFQSSSEFAKRTQDQKHDQVMSAMIKAAAPIAGSWVQSPKWKDLHYWKFSRPEKTISKPFLEYRDDTAPLAVVGDYFEGGGFESAWLSGKKLADHWKSKFANKK